MKFNKPPLIRARRFEDFPDLDPTGWWVSERFSGVRAYWDGKNLFQSSGELIQAPDSFVEDFPACPLDGQLWIDREVALKIPIDDSVWNSIKFLLFDLPDLKDNPYEERQNVLETMWRRSKSSALRLIDKQEQVKSRDHLLDELLRTQKFGVYELILREPGSKYKAGRSSSILKARTIDIRTGLVVPFGTLTGGFELNTDTKSRSPYERCADEHDRDCPQYDDSGWLNHLGHAGIKCNCPVGDTVHTHLYSKSEEIDISMGRENST